MRVRFKNRETPATAAASGQAGFRPAPGTKKGRVVLFLFGLPFFAAGVLFCWVGGIRPIIGAVESGSWPQVPCRIVSSEVERNAGSDGDTYRAAITFSYTFEGREYTGGRYDFSDMSSSGYDGKARIVRQYPVGHQTECWVNPRDPTIAVLARGIPGVVYLVIPFTSIFILVGGTIMLGAAGLLPEKWTSAVRSSHKRVTQAEKGELQLKPSSGPVAKLIGALLFALFWNGIVATAMWAVIGGFRKGDPEWFLLLFLVPFVAVGLGAVGFVVYFALALANPKPRLSLDEGSPRLGGTVRLHWHLSGAIHRLQNLTITLEGRESATYRVGTRSVTDTSLFCRQMLFETADPSAHRNGEIHFSIPANLIHTFSAGNNRIQWSLHVRGAIARWPDVNDSYPIIIRPHQTSGA